MSSIVTNAPQISTLQKAPAGLSTHAIVYHCGRDWNLGNLDAKINLRVWRYKLHFKLKHRKEMKK